MHRYTNLDAKEMLIVHNYRDVEVVLKKILSNQILKTTIINDWRQNVLVFNPNNKEDIKNYDNYMRSKL